jgi:hypothetical protein
MLRRCGHAHLRRGGLRPPKCSWPSLGLGNSRSARPARKTSLFGKPALEAGRDEKARSVVALSRVPRSAGFAGSPPAAGPFAAVNRPLVRIPANQHTTTGTCEIGQTKRYAIRRALQAFFSTKSPICSARMVKTYTRPARANDRKDCLAMLRTNYRSIYVGSTGGSKKERRSLSPSMERVNPLRCVSPSHRRGFLLP